MGDQAANEIEPSSQTGLAQTYEIKTTNQIKTSANRTGEARFYADTLTMLLGTRRTRNAVGG